ncbi:hypothetical protein ACGFNY_44700 [Streptomyces chartreusis]|uniref:hypothetical protein n=1 Tax=Streptomyces chartreusis TaxID=1969 RepID=UPI00371E63D4
MRIVGAGRRWRRIDNHRNDLTELGQLLRRIQVLLQLLADADTMTTVADSQALRALKYELQGSDVPFAPEAAVAVTEVIRRLDGLLGEATTYAAT